MLRKEEVKKALESEGLEFEFTENYKGQGVIILSYTYGQGKNKVSPIFYYEEFTSIQDFMSAIHKYKNEKFEYDFSEFLDFDSSKDYIFLNFIRNPNKDMIFYKIEDFYLVPTLMKDDYLTVLTHPLLKAWGKTEADVMKIAEENSEKRHYLFQSLDSLLEEIVEHPDVNEKSGVYILNYDDIERWAGATILLNKKILQRVSSQIGSFYILPSSTEEILLVPSNEPWLETSQQLREMVRVVNDSVVEKRVLLSYNIFFYDRKKKTMVTV